MTKKTLAIFVALVVLTSQLASPAFAQQQQGGSNSGFFGMFAQFFSHMFGGQQNSQTPQGGQNLPSGTPTGISNPSGTPGQMGEENRLQGLVTAGKLTEAQAQEVTAEVSKIKAEIQSWASSTGINAAYVYGALRGPGMSGGIGQGGTVPSGTQGRPGFTPGGQGGYQQGGQQGGQLGPRGNR